MAEVFASGRERRFECSLGEHWYDIRLSPEFDGDVVRSVVSVARDITKQQRAIADLRESQRVYRAIGESIDYGVWVCAPDGRCIYASESFLKMVGITEQQCIDDGWINSLHPDDAEKTLAAWKECVRTGGTWDVEHRYRGADGAWHPVLARGVPVHDDDGRVVCWAGINLDIQQQKSVEEELRGVSDAKDRLLAILAHDLRGPMGSLATVLELVRAGELGFTDALRQAVAESSRKLFQLLEDLLIWTQTHTSRLDPTVTNIPLEELLAEVSSLYELPASHKGVHLSVAPCPPSACVRGDLHMLRTVVRNLVGNAVKFTGRGGSVEVSARAIGARIEIRVHDTGVGVDTRTMASSPTSIPDSRIGTDRETGMGIGLAMSRDFVARNGGHLTFDSTPGLGTRVVVDLPSATIGDTTSPDLGPTLSRITTQRFLLVEDDPLHREAAGAVLDGLSITWDHASDAVAAMALAGRQRYDVVLLDINLPGVSGIELAHRLISCMDPPPSLIALTAYRRDELEALTKSHPVPFHDTLRKPLDRAALVRSLAALPAVATGPGIDT